MLHFSIRDLLWLMVVVGMGDGWGADGYQKNVAPIEITNARPFAPSPTPFPG